MTNSDANRACATRAHVVLTSCVRLNGRDGFDHARIAHAMTTIMAMTAPITIAMSAGEAFSFPPRKGLSPIHDMVSPISRTKLVLCSAAQAMYGTGSFHECVNFTIDKSDAEMNSSGKALSLNSGAGSRSNERSAADQISPEPSNISSKIEWPDT